MTSLTPPLLAIAKTSFLLALNLLRPTSYAPHVATPSTHHPSHSTAKPCASSPREHRWRRHVLICSRLYGHVPPLHRRRMLLLLLLHNW